MMSFSIEVLSDKKYDIRRILQVLRLGLMSAMILGAAMACDVFLKFAFMPIFYYRKTITNTEHDHLQ